MNNSYERQGFSYAGVFMFLCVLSNVLSFVLGILLGGGVIEF